MKKVLIFHPTIAPYRIDFFNDIYESFNTKICLYYKNLKDQTFKYEDIEKKFCFKPDYLEKSITILGREMPLGFIKKIREETPDIVIVNEYSESYWISRFYRAISGRKFKIITICDDSVDIVNNEGGLHAKARALALKKIDGVLLCNELVNDVYQKYYPNVKTFVMPIIQEEKHFFEDKVKIVNRAIEIAEKEKLYGKRIYLYVGRISPEKNPLYLVKSFIKQHVNNKENILYVIGDNIPTNENYNNEIDEYIKSHNATNYVRKIGRREGDELKSWFYAAQVLVVPSIREPFGAVANEALLCGNNVMISSIAGSRCLINDENGEVIDISAGTIDFSKMNNRVPLLSKDYINNKKNKMLVQYREYIVDLVNWINNL